MEAVKEADCPPLPEFFLVLNVEFDVMPLAVNLTYNLDNVPADLNLV